jgi:hypothetical protein
MMKHVLHGYDDGGAIEILQSLPISPVDSLSPSHSACRFAQYFRFWREIQPSLFSFPEANIEGHEGD